MMKQKISRLFIVVTVIAALPAILFPTFMLAGDKAPAQIQKALLYGFPVYLIVSALLSCLCYAERRVLAWILVAVMFLSDVAMWLLLSVS